MFFDHMKYCINLHGPFKRSSHRSLKCLKVLELAFFSGKSEIILSEEGGSRRRAQSWGSDWETVENLVEMRMLTKLSVIGPEPTHSLHAESHAPPQCRRERFHRSFLPATVRLYSYLPAQIFTLFSGQSDISAHYYNLHMTVHLVQ